MASHVIVDFEQVDMTRIVSKIQLLKVRAVIKTRYQHVLPIIFGRQPHPHGRVQIRLGPNHLQPARQPPYAPDLVTRAPSPGRSRLHFGFDQQSDPSSCTSYHSRMVDPRGERMGKVGHQDDQDGPSGSA